MALAWFFILVSSLALAVSVQGQPGFISIDCGIANDLTYIDPNDNITYMSDSQFIETGVNEYVRISPDNLRRFYRTVRSFPNGNRSCYNLGSVVNKGNKYLIRAYFLYGDYDGKNNVPTFDLFIGVNFWDNIAFDDATEEFKTEIITIASMNFISVCLVNTGYGTPFISALELRPLNNSMYGVVNESHSLYLLGRFDIGRPIYKDNIRYPEDPFDLIWETKEDASWISFNTTQNVTNKDVAIEPLSTVMITAVCPINDSDALYYSWTDYYAWKNHVYLHFAELELLGPNMTREFTVCCGNNSCHNSPIRPEYLVTTTVEYPLPLTGQYDRSCSIKKTPTSTLPPILNAIETFIIWQPTTTPTREKDVEAMADIKATYKILERNWMGDPCVPEIYKWEGLTCNNTHSDAPAIVSLNLSSAGLKGKIAASLANLKSIQSLDLSWNYLTGPVPNFLGDLPFLSSFLDGNPDLGVPGSCSRHSSKRKITILIAASVVSVVILSILLIILRRFKWRKEDPIVKPKEAGDLVSSEKRQFTYAEVITMTNNFRRAIGKGGFGTVYHGQMPDGTQVAVKMLSLQSVNLLSHKCQGSDEFQNEVRLNYCYIHSWVGPLFHCKDEKRMPQHEMSMGNGTDGGSQWAILQPKWLKDKDPYGSRCLGLTPQTRIPPKEESSTNPKGLAEWSRPRFLPLPELDVLVSTPSSPLFRNRRLCPLVRPPGNHRGFTWLLSRPGGISSVQRIGNSSLAKKKKKPHLKF